MSVLVKGMEMPESCGLCPCFHAEHLMYCQAVKADKEKRIVAPYGIQRPSWCPLMEVPPHGNLIDADELRRVHTEAERGRYGGLYLVGDNRFMQRFEAAPIVIEAEVNDT